MEGSSIRDRVLGGRPNISQQHQTTAADSTNSRRRAPSAKPPSGVSASAPNVAQPSQGEAGGTAAHRYYTPTGEGRGGDNPAQNDVGTDDELRTFNGQDLGGSGGIYRLPSLGDNTNPPTPTQRRSIPINNATPTATAIRDTSPIPRAPQSRNVSVMLASEHLSVRSNSLMDEQISPRLPTLSDRINNRSGSRHNNTTAASNTAIPTYETHEALVMMWMYTGLMKNRTIDEAFVPKDAGSWRPRKLSVTLENKGNAKGEVIKTGTIKIQKFDNKHSIRLEDQIHLLKAVTRFVIPKSHPVPFPTNPEGNEVTDFENFHDDNEDQNNGSFGPNSALHHSFSRSFGHGQMLMNREQSVDGFDPRSSNYTEQVPYFMRNGTAAGSFAFGEGASADGSSSNVPVYSKKHDVEINRRFTCGNIGLRIVSSTGKVYLMAMQNCPEVDSWLETLREVIQVHERDATFEEPAPNTLIASQSLLARPDCGQYKRDFLAIDLSKKDRSGKGSTKITVDEPPNHGNLMMLSDGAKKKAQWRMWAQIPGEAGNISCYKMKQSMLGKPLERFMSMIGSTPDFHTIDANSCEIFVEVPWLSTVIELTSTSMQGVLYLECDKIEMRIQWEQWLQLMGATKVLSLEERSALNQDDAFSLTTSFFFRDDDMESETGSSHSTKLRADSFLAVKYAASRGRTRRGRSIMGDLYQDDDELGGSTRSLDRAHAEDIPAHPDAPYRKVSQAPDIASEDKPSTANSPPAKGYVADIVRQQEIIDANRVALQIEEEAFREHLIDEENRRLYEFEDAMEGVLRLVREDRHKQRMDAEQKQREEEIAKVKARTATQKDLDGLKVKQQRQLTIQRPSTSLDSLIASADQVGERAGANRLDYSKRSMYPPSHGTYRPNAFGRSQDVVISMSGDGTTGSKSRGGLINHHSDVFDGDTSGRLLHLTSNAGLTTLRCPRRAGGGNDDSLALSDVCSNPPQLGESDDHGSTMGSLDASARRYDPSRIYDGSDPEIASIGSTRSRAHANVDADGLPNESFITNALNFSYEYPNSPAPRPFQREGDIDPLEERSPKADSATRYLSTIHRKRAEMLNKNQRDSERAIMFCAICGANKKEVVKCPVTNRKHVTQIITERERQREVARRHLIL